MLEVRLVCHRKRLASLSFQLNDLRVGPTQADSCEQACTDAGKLAETGLGPRHGSERHARGKLQAHGVSMVVAVQGKMLASGGQPQPEVAYADLYS